MTGELRLAIDDAAVDVVGRLLATVRCLSGTVYVGARFQMADDRRVDLALTRIVCDGTDVDLVDPPAHARVVFYGAGADLVRPGQTVSGVRPRGGPW